MVLQLAKYLPVKDPQLEPECYQCVLIAALHNHPVLFYNLVKVWNPDLFRVGRYLNSFIHLFILLCMVSVKFFEWQIKSERENSRFKLRIVML